ncbi:MAG TPA: CaiB/BaiF CoA-transferase family protein [Caulobacteraceae bacterium]|jgi:alpha-methylacyl-CoA racemase
MSRAQPEPDERARAAGAGPLRGLRVLEFAGLAPVPFCGMLLADLGAEVLRIDRRGVAPMPPVDVLGRGKRSVALDLKRPEAVAACLDLVASADALLEGYRPGVMERLGLGPDAVLARNPKLVYGRLTGWGQAGPKASEPGHDINYVALSGALEAIGTPERPVPPLNLLGDFAGGALYLAFGVLAALRHAEQTGEGQVVDCAMVDGAASMMSLFSGLRASGMWNGPRGANLLDGGAPFYGVYECADGGFMAVGALEPPFHARLLEVLDLPAEDFQPQMDPAAWAQRRERVAAAFRTRSRGEWTALFEGSDACVTPVLSLAEAPMHPHNAARRTFIEVDGLTQPTPAPRFSATAGRIRAPAPPVGAESSRAALESWGFSTDAVDALAAAGAL